MKARQGFLTFVYYLDVIAGANKMPKEEKPPEKKVDWEKDFFDKHGVTDDKEKDAIRSRAKVLAYDRARSKREAEEEGEGKPPSEKKWYQE
jgi:hypothetical protein